jgi:hypothetical protein
MICKNCFQTIADARKETKCSVCNKPLHKDCAIKDSVVLCDVCYVVKDEGGKDLKEAFKVPEIIRRSYIEEYKSCPYSFYLNVIKGVEKESSSFAQIGIDLHVLFSQVCSRKLDTSKGTDEIIRVYKGIFDKYEDKLFEQDLHLYKDMDLANFKSKMWKQSLDAIDTFFSVLATLPTNAYAVEENILFGVGDDLPKVSITMDRVDEIDGQLEVSDWKTGAVKVGQALSNDLQAPLYIKAIREHYKKPVRKFTFYYLPENKVRIWERVDEDNYVCTVNKRQYKINITDAIRDVQSVFAQIIKGNFNIPRDTKKMYFSCKTCYYKRSGNCQGAETESWRQYNQGGK